LGFKYTPIILTLMDLGELVTTNSRKRQAVNHLPNSLPELWAVGWLALPVGAPGMLNFGLITGVTRLLLEPTVELLRDSALR